MTSGEDTLTPAQGAPSPPDRFVFREPGTPKPRLYFVTQRLFRWLGGLYFGIEAEGTEKFPEEGACLILANHTSFIDPALIGLVIERELHYLARVGAVTFGPVAWWMRKNNTHLIRRDGIDREAIRTCSRVLDAGWPLVFFPEGTRSPDGRPQPLRGGFAMLLEKTPDVPCVPMRIEGAFESLGRGKFFPRPRTLRLIVGDPFVLPPREPKEKRRDYFDRCAAIVEERWRELAPPPAGS